MPSAKSLREEGAVLAAQDENNIGAFFSFWGEREGKEEGQSGSLTLVAHVRS